MKKLLYPKLAWSGICKNRKLYLPYLFSCIGMVTMFYLIHSLSYSPLLHEMRGGRDIEFVLSLGKFVIAIFSLIFLLYTNSFLIRRRYKEFGLYNILGMDKRGISRIVFWESLTVSAMALTGGILFGILLSKFAELGLLNMIHAEIDYRFTVSLEAVGFSAGIFSTIFLLLMIKSLIQVRCAKPLELLQTENTGEKAPRANWAFALIGLLILGAAYALAVSIKSPLTALSVFFIAVIMVIVATYLLFMSGSVALCKLLQKSNCFYYRKNHFVSVSTMAFRMKRNGAGLASICILSTMVLVMISSTSSLYFGANDSIESRYTRENELKVMLPKVEHLKEESISQIRGEYEKVFRNHGIAPQNLLEYRYASIAGQLTGKEADLSAGTENLMVQYDDVRIFLFVSLEDYNRTMGTTLSLSPGEAYLWTVDCEYREESLKIGGLELSIAGKLDRFMQIETGYSTIVPTILLVLPDYDTLLPLDTLLDVRYYYGYDLDVPDKEAISVLEDLENSILNCAFLNQGGYGYSSACLAAEKNVFFVTYGGLFFLGIVLSIVFIFAAAMIIYYKQISEGYEDQSRFAIMRKVGMTREDIKKNINSQVRMVFFAPLLFAGCHLAFAFPLVWKILRLFGLNNLTLVLCVSAGAFLLFGIFYAGIYHITARAYYSIVSADEED